MHQSDYRFVLKRQNCQKMFFALGRFHSNLVVLCTPLVFFAPCTRVRRQVLLKGDSTALKDHIGADEVSWRLRLAERL